jgi:small nuclear ribonucleoprotein (snRNP)-like protein
MVMSSPLWSEIVFMDDGTIYIGSIIGAESGGMRYLAYGREESLRSDAIQRTEKDLKVLEGLPVTVELMDGSLLRGTIADFDAEIGLFLDIAFGVLTIPNQSIKSIVDPARRVRYAGTPFLVRGGASFYFPILDAASRFGPSIAVDLDAEWSVPILRGLFAGFDARYSFADFIPVATAQYGFTSVAPEVSYRFLFLRTREDFLRSLTPFVSVGMGPVYVSLVDTTAYPPVMGELSLGINAKLGLDIDFWEGLGIRLQGRGDLYIQQGSPFISLSAGLMVSYDR